MEQPWRRRGIYWLIITPSYSSRQDQDQPRLGPKTTRGGLNCNARTELPLLQEIDRLPVQGRGVKPVRPEGMQRVAG
jgi:hypothetical protein